MRRKTGSPGRLSQHLGMDTPLPRPRPFDFAACKLHLRPGDTDIKAAASAAWDLVRAYGLDTIEGCNQNNRKGQHG